MAERRLMAAPPDVLRWVPRSDGHGDCAVAALELACGVTYETALAACLKVEPQVLTEGMTVGQIRRAARVLGLKAVYRGWSKATKRKPTKPLFDLDDDTGILSVNQPHVEDSGHVVYLWEGRIIEPMNARQQLWLNAHDFLSHYKYEAEGIITLTREEQ